MPVRTLTDLRLLDQRAKEQHRLIVLFFTGLSGDCGDCAMMDRKFIQNQAFMTWVDDHAVFGLVDVSLRKQLNLGRDVANGGDRGINEVMLLTRAPTVPSLALYDTDNELLEYTNGKDEPAAVIAAFQAVYDKMITKRPRIKPEPFLRAEDDSRLKLKMVSGAGQHQLATINDKTFATGETHDVSIGNQTLAVKCLEIREKSVLVKVAGEASPRELTVADTHRVGTGIVVSKAEVLVHKFRHVQATIHYYVWLVVAILYLPFSWSCWRICRRTGYSSAVLVWLPIVKRLALLRATELSSLWFSLSLIPLLGPLVAALGWILCYRHGWKTLCDAGWLWVSLGGIAPLLGFLVYCIGWILCCRRLCGIFGKSKWWVLLMIWPWIGWLMFIYLATCELSQNHGPAGIRVLNQGRQFV